MPVARTSTQVSAAQISRDLCNAQISARAGKREAEYLADQVRFEAADRMIQAAHDLIHPMLHIADQPREE